MCEAATQILILRFSYKALYQQ